MAQYFISDLHLEEEKPALTRFFFDFLQLISPTAESLYILGDFFEVWIGDDEQTPLQRDVANRLHRLSDNGASIFLMHGNRDFLIGTSYAEQCGAELIHEPYPITLAGRKALLMHGDSLCTDDQQYMKFRQMTRDSAWQQQVLKRPLPDRKVMARQLRQMSEAKNQGKSMEIMDVAQATVENLFIKEDIDLLVHGHTHRPAVHKLTVRSQSVQRIVLGDWGDSTWYGKAEGDRFELLKIESSSQAEG